MDQMVAAALQETPTLSNEPEKVLSGEWSVIRTTRFPFSNPNFFKVGSNMNALSMILPLDFLSGISP